MAGRRPLLPRLTLSASLTAAAAGSTAWGQAPSPPPPPLPALPPSDVAAPTPSGPPIVLPPLPNAPAGAPHVHGWWKRRHCAQCNNRAPYVLPPFGANVYTVNRIQVTNNDAYRLILRHYDFIDETTELNPYGRIRLNEIIARSASIPVPIIIEWTLDNPGLDQARRTAVVDLLAKAQVPIEGERVVVGPDMSGRLRGVEAEIIFANQLARMAATSPAVGIGVGPGAFAGTNTQARPGR